MTWRVRDLSDPCGIVTGHSKFSRPRIAFGPTMSSRTIVLASRNKKKTQEVREILARVGFTVISVTDFCGVPDVEEDGRTFAENAAKKASEVARHLNQWVIGEDSGLMVDALNGLRNLLRSL